MTKLETIENGIGSIYHEVGHVFGYCLANQNSSTYLGEITEFSIGIIKSCVGVENSFYHFKDLKLERDRIYSNTSNRERTVAWFLEVISGCTFQAYFEKKDFQLCFGPEENKGGNNDFYNISAIRQISNLKFNFEDIYTLQNKYLQLIMKHDLIEKFLPLITGIKNELLESDSIQINYEKDRIIYYFNQCKELISDELYEDYRIIIDEFQII